MGFHCDLQTIFINSNVKFVKIRNKSIISFKVQNNPDLTVSIPLQSILSCFSALVKYSPA